MNISLFLYFSALKIDFYIKILYNSFWVIIMLERFTITDIERIILVDKNEYPEKYTTFNPIFNSYELIYKFDGNMILNFNSKQYKISAGTVYILPKGNNNNYSVERHEPGKCIDIYFQCEERLVADAFVQKVAINGKIDNLFNKAFSVWASKNQGYYLQCLSIIYQILYEIQTPLYMSKDKSKKIKPALKYIDSHFTEKDISCEELANLCGISYSYLKGLFIEQYKLSPNKYINKMRINYACDLLREKRYTVTQIAEMSGFSDVFYFCKFFKKNVGITPTQFKNKYISSK